MSDLVNIIPMVEMAKTGAHKSELGENSRGKYLSLNGYYFWNGRHISIINPDEIIPKQEYTMYFKGSVRRIRFFDENKDQLTYLEVSDMVGATAENPAEVNFNFTPPTGTKYVTLYAGGNTTRINIFAISIFKSNRTPKLRYDKNSYTYINEVLENPDLIFTKKNIKAGINIDVDINGDNVIVSSPEKDLIQEELIVGSPVELKRKGISFKRIIKSTVGGRFQSIAYNRGRIFCASSRGDIEVWDYNTGKLLKEVNLDVGHASDMDYREADGTLWISASGGRSPFDYSIIDIESENPTVIKRWTMVGKGPCSIDNEKDEIWLGGGNRFRCYDMDTKRLKRAVTYKAFSKEAGQGTCFNDNRIFYSKGGGKTNFIEMINLADGSNELLKFKTYSESQGIAVVDDQENVRLLLGRSSKSIYEVIL